MERRRGGLVCWRGARARRGLTVVCVCVCWLWQGLQVVQRCGVWHCQVRAGPRSRTSWRQCPEVGLTGVSSGAVAATVQRLRRLQWLFCDHGVGAAGGGGGAVAGWLSSMESWASPRSGVGGVWGQGAAFQAGRPLSVACLVGCCRWFVCWAGSWFRVAGIPAASAERCWWLVACRVHFALVGGGSVKQLPLFCWAGRVVSCCWWRLGGVSLLVVGLARAGGQACVARCGLCVSVCPGASMARPRAALGRGCFS